MILLPKADEKTFLFLFLLVVVVVVVRSWFLLLSYPILVSCQLTKSARLLMAA